VILPVFNGKAFIRKAIRSVISQSYKYFELLVIDDASNDGSGKIVKSFRDPRIKYISNRKNVGPCKARNIGLKNASGEYIAYIDHDDYWYRNHLGAMVNVLNERPDIGLVFAGFRITGTHRVPWMPRIFPSHKFSKQCLENENIIGSPFNVMHRKSCVDKVGGFDEHKLLNRACYEDWDLWLRISDICRIYYLSKIYGKYVFHGNNRSYSVNVFSSYMYVIKKRLKKYKASGNVEYYAPCVIFELSVRAAHNNIGVWRVVSKNLIDFRGGKCRALLKQYCAGINLYVKRDYVNASAILDKCQNLLMKNFSQERYIIKQATLAITLFRAKCAYEINDLKKALRFHKKNIRINKNYMPSLEQAALISFKLGRYKDTWKFAQRLNLSFFYFLKGGYFMKKGRYLRAITFFNKVLELNPNNAQVKKICNLLNMYILTPDKKSEHIKKRTKS